MVLICHTIRLMVTIGINTNVGILIINFIVMTILLIMTVTVTIGNIVINVIIAFVAMIVFLRST